MICYESVVKNVVDIALFFFFFHNTYLFSCDWFQYNIYICYKELIPQQLRKYCDNLL